MWSAERITCEFGGSQAQPRNSHGLPRRYLGEKGNMQRSVNDLRPESSLSLPARIGLVCFAVLLGVTGFAFATHQQHHVRPATTYNINFTLANSYTTSAGVYDANGALVRTLWGNQPLAAGTYQKTWDGTDDSGNVAPAGSYSVKLLTHNMSATWDGVLGNTSQYMTGPTHIGGLGNISDVLCVGSEVYVLRCYNEAGEKLDKFDRSTPGQISPSGVGLPNAWLPAAIATDGVRMYVADYPLSVYTSNPTSIVCAYYLDDVSGAYTFTNIAKVAGTGVGQNDNGHWINLGSGYSGTTLAVQTNGTALAVGQYSNGQIQLFDKLGGQPLSGPQFTFTVPGLIAMKWSADENTLWTATGNNVLGWQYNGTAWTQVASINGTQPVKSFAVNPTDGSLGILYGGTDQQLRGYTPQGTWLYTVGSRGGYASGPAVNDTKFMIPPDFNNGEQFGGGVGFENDGKVWIIDNGDSRMLRFPVHKHLAAARKDALFSMVTGYQLAVDKNNPARLFTGYLEFSRDYTKALNQGAGLSWTLTNNWGYGYWQRNSAKSTIDGLTQVVTASNGHTYAILQPADTPPWGSYIAELRPSGLRNINWLGWFSIDANMSLWSVAASTGVNSIQRATLSSFDSNNNPVWSSPSQYCSMPTGPNLPSWNGGYTLSGGASFDTLPDGSMVSYNTDVGSSSYGKPYLGFIKPGGTTYYVQTARSSRCTPLTHDGHVAVGGLPNASTIPTVGGRVLGNIVAMFCIGEFFDGGEADQILLYDASGLPLLDIGTRGVAGVWQSTAASGKAGNMIANAFVLGTDGSPHIFTSDESTSAGIHEWTLNNAKSVRVASAQFDNTNTANFGTLAAVTPLAKRATSGGTISSASDNFNRVDSNTIGNGWLDPNARFGIRSGQLKDITGAWYDWNNACLVRQEQGIDSVQSVSIPVQDYDSSRMAVGGGTSIGSWGVFSRRQPTGDRYFADMVFIGAQTLDQPGHIDVRIGEIVSGTVLTLAFDRCDIAPAAPGHAYALSLTTSGVGPTQLHCVVTDTTTGQVFATLDQSSDQPELQALGGIGIQGAFANNAFSGYSMTVSTSTSIKAANVPRP